MEIHFHAGLTSALDGGEWSSLLHQFSHHIYSCFMKATYRSRFIIQKELRVTIHQWHRDLLNCAPTSKLIGHTKLCICNLRPTSTCTTSYYW